jgi:hypothetical protein
MSVETYVRRPDKFFIGGAWVDPAGTSTFSVLNCSTEEPFERAAEAVAADVDRAVDAAREAFDRGPWPRMSHLERTGHLRIIANEVDNIGDANTCTWTEKVGVLHQVSKVTALNLGNTYQPYAELAETFRLRSGPSRSSAAQSRSSCVSPSAWSGRSSPGTGRRAPATCSRRSPRPHSRPQRDALRARLALRGSFKQSGLGREDGRQGLLPYLETKSLILEGMPSNAGSAVLALGTAPPPRGGAAPRSSEQ